MRLHAAPVHALKWIGVALLAAGTLVVGLVAGGFGIAPARTDVLVVGLDSEPRSLDPHATTRASDFRVLVNVYEGLVRYRQGTLTPEPGLARHWTISADATEYVFELRPGIRFHDGTPCDAAAIKFNFDRMLDDAHPYHDTGPFPLSFFFEQVREVEVLDPLRVRFELNEPFAPLLANLAYPTGLIVSPAAVRRLGRGIGRQPVGTGPYRFSHWHAGRHIVLERNSAYHAQTAKLSRLVFRTVSDPMTRVAELRAKFIDVVPELMPDSVQWFQEAPDFEVAQAPGPHLWFLILNTRRPPFDDVRVRRAVNLAVDKHALVSNVLQHTASVAAGPIAEAFGAAAGDVEPYPYDPHLARQLLTQAGLDEGASLTLAVPTGGAGMLAPVQMATAIQADLAGVGLEVNIQTFEWNSYLTRVNEGLDDIDMAAMAWMTNDPDTLPFLALRTNAHPPAGFNSGWYSNQQVDRLLARARATSTRDERAALYATVQRIVHDDAPWLFVASWKQNIVSRKGLSGLRVEPSFLLYLDQVYQR